MVSVLQLRRILRHRLPRGGDSDGSEVFDDLLRSRRMLLVRVLPQVLEDVQGSVLVDHMRAPAFSL